MALRRHAALLSLAVVLLFAGLAAASPTSQNTGDTVIFWGRNKDEGSLREACDTGLYTTVIISFLSAFGYKPGYYKVDISGHPVSAVGPDIKYCQSKGILILLAIGGQGGEYSLPTPQAAVELNDHLWYSYLGGHRNGVYRPFGDAIVNGIDFFIDQGGRENYNKLAKLLYAHNKDYRGTVGVMLTATTRCEYPDHRLDEALATGLFHRIHVKKFSDGRCPASSWIQSFQKWAKMYPQSRVLVGVVASREVDREAYISPEDLKKLMQYVFSKLPNFGGVMVWDRFYDEKTGFTGRLRASR
uniref:Xylanase inhibitor protein n=5 Tax=Oryza TaxID=4527 RepID=A0A345DGH7_ORYSJ|nr:xylanase inhibitor protein [Oryza sativa Japonica Group]AXF92898.1 xylanase inhibitor protein [Oryza sativa Japonica Group]